MVSSESRFAATRIGLIRQGDRPRLNSALATMLGETFPGHPVDDVDVLDAVRRDTGRYGWSIASGAIEHVRPLARGRIRPKRAVVTSSGFARAARSVVAGRIGPMTHRFSFQSQSLYPVAVDGVPNFVYTDHAHLANLGYPGFDIADLMPTRYLRAETQVYRSAAMVFTRSEHVRHTIIHGYGCSPSKVAVVGVGPNTSPTEPERSDWNGGAIVFVGVDWRRKGGPQLIEAFTRVRRRHPSARLHIVGCDIADIGGVERLADGVTVHGRLVVDEVTRILGASDVFCLPTLAEPFGVAYIEAMHAGLPVVATDIGATPDFVVPGSTGTLVAPHDIDALTSALCEMLDDPEATMQMGREARRLAMKRYSWNVVMASIREHVSEFLEQRADAEPQRGNGK